MSSDLNIPHLLFFAWRYLRRANPLRPHRSGVTLAGCYYGPKALLQRSSVKLFSRIVHGLESSGEDLEFDHRLVISSPTIVIPLFFILHIWRPLLPKAPQLDGRRQ